ncbi:MAG: hypothetical protein ACOX1U_06485 [Saccharofermentanales bacterium]|jgi:hypothetical protein
MVRKIFVPYGMPEEGGVAQSPPYMLGTPGFGAPRFPGFVAMYPFEIPDCEFKPQVRIDSNRLSKASVMDAELSGTVGIESAEGVRMACDKDCINGFYIAGNSKYTIKDTEMDFKGNGINDFAGRGAQVQIDDNAVVVIENSKFTTTGVIRPCFCAGGSSTLIVRNCELIGNGGVLDHKPRPIPGPGMEVPPPALELEGNCRTHLSVGNSHSYFYDSKIVADGWAALSTDASDGDLYLEANRCDIIVRKKGYATFSDGGCYVVLNDCKIESGAQAMILAGRSKGVLNNCSVKAGANCSMIISINGNTSMISHLTINGGNIETESDMFRVKSANAHLDLRNVRLKAKSGVLIRTEILDDIMATKVQPGTVVYGVKAIFADMEAEGDILSEDANRTIAVTLTHTNLKGGIKDAFLKLDPSSTWFATKDSVVTLIDTVIEGQIDAPAGVVINALSDTLESGSSIQLKSGGVLNIR